MELEELRREAIRCRNLGNREAHVEDAAWYRDRGIRLTEAADLMEAEIAAEPKAPHRAAPPSELPPAA